MNSKDLGNDIRSAVNDRVRSVIVPRTASRELAILLELGVPVSTIAKALGIKQGTASAYTRGFRESFPEKHRGALYDMLEEAVDAAVRTLQTIERYAPKGFKEHVQERDYKIEMTDEEYEEHFRILFGKEPHGVHSLKSINIDGYYAMMTFIEGALFLSE